MSPFAKFNYQFARYIISNAYHNGLQTFLKDHPHLYFYIHFIMHSLWRKNNFLFTPLWPDAETDFTLCRYGFNHLKMTEIGDHKIDFNPNWHEG